MSCRIRKYDDFKEYPKNDDFISKNTRRMMIFTPKVMKISVRFRFSI